MSAWRRKALESFPGLREDLQRRNYSIYQLFFDLLAMAREAHAAGHNETLIEIYGFAEWCLQQKAADMWNAAGVAFYEHLFDQGEAYWHDVASRLTADVIRKCWPLWEARLHPDKLHKLEKLLRRRAEATRAPQSSRGSQ